jgi:hypothetical protein
MNSYIDYRLALALNEEARQKAALYHLAQLHRTPSRFLRAIQNLFAKAQSQKRGKYGLQ